MASGSFEPIADWWDSAVGEAGDEFHRHLSRPALLRVLGDVTGLDVLDLGCGNGASTRPLARLGASATGIDLSPTLIAHAWRYEEREPLGIRYLVGSASALPVPGDAFDRVVADMVLMDLEDAEATFAEVARALRPGGRFVATLFHPCFQIVEGSSWLIEQEEFAQRISRRVWRYRDVFSAEGVAKLDQPEPHRYYHRPLSWYVSRLARHGLLLDTLDEPKPDTAFTDARPDFAARDAVAPTLLVLGAALTP
jgi:ubiquinone/menaquinone biosynthesis C-methylase UbiE